MIKNNIINEFPNHSLNTYQDDVYVADYSLQTQHARSVEVFSPDPCNDIDYLSVTNPTKLALEVVIFDNTSFTFNCGKPKSQCEVSLFPTISDENSWILFSELKYSCLPKNNKHNLKKAIKQLFKTRYHYIQAGVFEEKDNTSYLIASLPMQDEPFSNFSLTPSYLYNLKNKHNVILRLQNSIEIFDESLILV
ncbi:hypothetical protein [Wenyingzhuangia sp. IMCC45574]